MKTSIVATKDGSLTLFVPEMNEHYHSVHGAISESKHVFIKHGLHYAAKKNNKLSILEVGFGTGLNTWLSWLETVKEDLEIYYEAYEPFPLSKDIWERLNYSKFENHMGSERIFNQLHESTWEVVHHINDGFVFVKRRQPIIKLQAKLLFDVVYFDAFGPDKQPELWTAQVFQRLFRSLKPGGVLTTYSAKGEVKRKLKACGFLVESLPGPPGKREMTRALRPY